MEIVSLVGALLLLLKCLFSVLKVFYRDLLCKFNIILVWWLFACSINRDICYFRYSIDIPESLLYQEPK